MRRKLQQYLMRGVQWLQPAPVPQPAPIIIETGIPDSQLRERERYVERCHELIEARQMAGSGPWLPQVARESGTRSLREAGAEVFQGATSDLELALQNVEWRREVNLSWLEFSRWGIQQIILICRLYYIKNPIARRLTNIVAAYVFGRGVEVSSPDDGANEVLEDFFERNKKVMGQVGLTEQERAKWTDGNVFWVFFADAESSGKTSIRTIDATEIEEIVTNPDDADEEWLFRRRWVKRNFDLNTGAITTGADEAWYPALDYDPDVKPEEINRIRIEWKRPIYHRACGRVGKWRMGCPRSYPAKDWERESRKILEAAASVKQSQAQYAMKITTKGGQQALQGIKGQLQTTVGPPSNLWDTNPTAVAGATFASGPGTTIEPFATRGMSPDPEEVRQYKLMCCMVYGVPETFLADVSTGNLATATTLDRPTELAMLELQEEWREDLVVIARYVLGVSKGAASGRLRESLEAQRMSPGDIKNVRIVEMRRKKLPTGEWVYLSEADRKKAPLPGVIEVAATFPSIREGDGAILAASVVNSMTLGNRGGQVVGIDAKEGVKKLYEIHGIENGDEIAESQYPDGEYDPNRANQPVIAPIGRAKPEPGGTTQLEPDGQTVPSDAPVNGKEAARIKAAAERLMEIANERNGK